jgi:hypothetical protein
MPYIILTPAHGLDKLISHLGVCHYITKTHLGGQDTLQMLNCVIGALDQCVRCCGAKIGEAQQEVPFWVCDAKLRNWCIELSIIQSSSASSFPSYGARIIAGF